jgi:uncharacterized membrane protein YeiH/ABC-type nitrate/sulfonate/bicarbonate transport system substrate-binding protein
MVKRLLVPLLFLLCASGLLAEPARELKVQLGWAHQASYAGFYMADSKKYYEAKGLDVVLVEGSGQINPLRELQAGKVDVAVSQMNDALLNNSADKPVVNIAQIFSDSAMLLICRGGPNLKEAKDIVGKRIAVAEWGDADLVRAMIQNISPGDSLTRYVPRSPGQMAINDGSADCMSAVSFNGYWSALETGLHAKDLFLLKPRDFGIQDMGDGLYVLRERLESAEFRKMISEFLAATIMGWKDAKTDRSQALTITLQQNPKLDYFHQQNMLETVLDLVPGNVGLLNLNDYSRVRDSAKLNFPNQIPEISLKENVWTHSIWSESQHQGGLTPATLHYLKTLSDSTWVTWLFITGLMVYALAGTLIAIDFGFDLWGRLVCAYLTCMGGGVVRDYFIGGERLPLKFIADPALPICVLILVVSVTLLNSWKPELGKHRTLHRFVNLPEYLGFGIVAIYGAIVSINAGMSMLWVPLCAASSIAGGGILRDIVINREPVNFRGKIFEEAAIVGAIVLVGLLYVANHFEGSPVPVYLAILTSIVFTISLHTLILRRGWLYPAWLGGPDKSSTK